MNHAGIKRPAMLAWLLLACMLLSSCAGGGIPLHEEETLTTLPPSAPQYVAPIGDAALEYASQATLFLPRHDGSRLVSLTAEVPFSPTRPHAESLVRELLNHEGDGVATPLGGSVRLSLYGANPVEVSRDVVTVNLAASALQLDRKALFLACQAITNTLTRLNGIHYVNILVMDRQVGLDIAGTLPMGTFARSVGEDVGAAYEQALSQRAAPEEDPADKRLSSLVTLYFPLAQLDGLVPEVRTVSFDSQKPADMVAHLLREMAAGPQQVPGSPTLPLLGDLLTEAPRVIEAPEGGGNLVVLRFSHTFDDMLATFGLTRANCLASLCYTLTTFLPNLTGIHVSIGEETVQNVRLLGTYSNQIAVMFQNGTQRRGDYALFLLDYCKLYFADASGQKLVQVDRAIPYYLTCHPRALVLELSKGPLPTDSAPGALPIMQPGILLDSDLLGFSISTNTLLVNFAPSFQEAGRGLSPQQDRLLAYGLVNTLCSISRIQKVCFFVGGNLPADFSGEIYWAGDFYKNPGLVQ